MPHFIVRGFFVRGFFLGARVSPLLATGDDAARFDYGPSFRRKLVSSSHVIFKVGRRDFRHTFCIMILGARSAGARQPSLLDNGMSVGSASHKPTSGPCRRSPRENVTSG